MTMHIAFHNIHYSISLHQHYKTSDEPLQTHILRIDELLKGTEINATPRNRESRVYCEHIKEEIKTRWALLQISVWTRNAVYVNRLKTSIFMEAMRPMTRIRQIKIVPYEKLKIIFHIMISKLTHSIHAIRCYLLCKMYHACVTLKCSNIISFRFRFEPIDYLQHNSDECEKQDAIDKIDVSELFFSF